MTDLLELYFYPHASGYASKNICTFLRTAELAHLLKCESISKDRLPAKLAKRNESAAATRPTSPVEYKYNIKKTETNAPPSKLFSSFFTASGENGETIRLYGTANKTCFNVNDTTFQITTVPAIHINIFGGTIAQKDEDSTLTNAYISLLCTIDDEQKITYIVSFLLVKDLAVQITYGEICNGIIDITSYWLPVKNHFTWLIMTNKNIHIGNGSQVTETFPKENHPEPTEPKKKKDKMEEKKENVTEILSERELFSCCTRGRYRDKPPFMLIGTSLGNIHKINFTRSGKLVVNKCTLHTQAKSQIFFICCGHLNNDQYQEFYYATLTKVYFDTLNEDMITNEGHKKNALWTRRHTDIPEGFDIGQLMCTQNEQRVIVYLSSKSKEVQSRLLIITNLKPESDKLKARHMFINKMPPSDLLYDDMTFAAVDDNEKIQIYSKQKTVHIQRLLTNQEFSEIYEESKKVWTNESTDESTDELTDEEATFTNSLEPASKEEKESSEEEEELPSDEKSYVEKLNDLKDDDRERFWAILEIIQTNGKLHEPVYDTQEISTEGLSIRDSLEIHISDIHLQTKLNALKDKDPPRFWAMVKIVKEKEVNLNIDFDKNRQENIKLMHEFENATKKSHENEINSINRLISLSRQEKQTVEAKKRIEKVIDNTIAWYLRTYVEFITNYNTATEPNSLTYGISSFRNFPTFISTLETLKKKRFIDETIRNEMKRLIEYVDSYKDKPEGKDFLKYSEEIPMW